MDSNKNKECCYSNGGRCASGGGLTVVIGTDCISKAVSAAKYQNQFNNNNLIEQENLMPPVHDRVSGMVQDDSSTSTLPKENGVVASNESPVKDKVLAENGSSRHITSIFNQTSTPIVSAGSDIPSERLLPSLQSSVDFFITSTNNVPSSFNPTTNGTGTDHLRTTLSSAHDSNGFGQPAIELASNGTGELPDETSRASAAERPVKLNDDACPPDEGDFSDNNSLGNLSYASENGLIEEIILLPNNVYSDDDNASTSDDCIYAYRGGEPDGAAGQLLDLQGDLPPDDETDFLEMDFDPEPSSEMENFNRQSDFMLGLDEDKFAGVARPALEGQQQEENVGNGSRSRIASPTVPSHSSAPHDPSGPLDREGETAQKGNDTGLHHVPEMNDGRSLVPSVPVLAASLAEDGNDQREQKADSTKGDSSISDQIVNRPEAHKTGAIPKSLPLLLADCSSTPTERGGLSVNAKTLRLEHSLHPDEPDARDARRYAPGSPFYHKAAEFGAGRQRPNGFDECAEELHCLDCAEQEFLMRTKQDPSRQRYCNACKAAKQEGKGRSAARSYERDSGRRVEGLFTGAGTNQPTVDDELWDQRAEQIVYEALHKINTLKEMPPTGGLVSRARPYQSQGSVPCVPAQREMPEQVTPDNDWCGQQVPHVRAKQTQREQSVTIYTFNCSLMTIMDSLTSFGLTPNEEVLRQYFYDQYEVDTSKMTIPQYLLHMSKRDCNYRKLIDAIQSSCDDELLDIQYYPLHPFSDMPETVEICASEIAKRWTANTNLRQIIHFKHKHFHTLNVLGKIVNILRQPSRGRHTNHMISIPQYYKSGILQIKRTGGW
ncbi:uncharacterized protein LOC118511745 [Anopheles stephensi]|uniref:uncharacterized protein LOC118511745 n=1 Tax=Anopheles stephensi TaxID=30069 RepID=UPI001658AC6D|nr:uncharacterized protein LOC118511745 [Anopheles stephensi]